MTWTQLLTPFLTILLLGWLAKRARRPGPIVDGWQVVRYGPPLRWVSAALCVGMLICGTVLVPSSLEDRRAPAETLVFGVLVILVPVLLSIYGMLFTWRNWVKYNGETMISSTTWKRPQTFSLA